MLFFVPGIDRAEKPQLFVLFGEDVVDADAEPRLFLQAPGRNVRAPAVAPGYRPRFLSLPGRVYGLFEPGEGGPYLVFYFDDHLFADTSVGFDLFGIVFVEVSHAADGLLSELAVLFDVFDDPDGDVVVFFPYQPNKHNPMMGGKSTPVKAKGHYFGGLKWK